MRKFAIASVLMIVAVSLKAAVPTIVDTLPRNKRVLSEEFTGIGCGNCPDGHKVANFIKSGHPEIVSLINIHAGHYAHPSGNDPDYRTWQGDEITEYFDYESLGAPTAGINRHIFKGGIVPQSRTLWTAYSRIINDQLTPVNVAGEATIDVASRQATVNVEAFYTGNDESTENYISVFVLQDRLIGPQNGAPSGSAYEHSHMLRDMLTPVWGDTIKSTQKGAFFSKTYSYNIPDSIGYTLDTVYRAPIPVIPENVSFVVIVSRSKSEVLDAYTIHPAVTGATRLNAARVIRPIMPRSMALQEINFIVENTGAKAIDSLTVNFTLNNAAETFVWKGDSVKSSIKPGEQHEIHLDFTTPIIFESSSAQPNAYTVVVKKINGVDNQEPTAANYTFSGTGVRGVNAPLEFYIKYRTDTNANENVVRILDTNYNVVFEIGPLPAGTVYSFDTLVTFPYGVYQLQWGDEWGDGIIGGELKLERVNNKGNRVSFLTVELTNTQSGTAVGIYNNGYAFFAGKLVDNKKGETISSYVNTYPNPVKDALTVVVGNNLKIKNVIVKDVLGRTLQTVNANENETVQLNLSDLPKGVYTINIHTDKGLDVKKIIKE